MNPEVRKRLERCTTLPTLPVVAVRIVQLCQRDDVDLKELGGVLSSDPALSAKILKLVNSPAFGMRREVRTVSQAVVLLGINAVRTLALSFSLTLDGTQRKRAALEAVWKRSVLSAIAARELAVALSFVRPEEAFLGALLQDIGVLALDQALGAEYEEMLAQAGDDHEALALLERRALEADHAEVGHWLLARWRLPEVLCRAVAASHTPGRLPGDVDPDTAALVRITAMSGALADIWARGDVGNATERAKVRATALLALPEAGLEQVLGRIAAVMPEIAGLFDVEVGGSEDVNQVLEEAREALVLLNLRASRHIDSAQRTINTLETRARQLEQEAAKDALTGLLNRGRLDAYLEEQFAAAVETGQPLSVILGDVDHFKAINDTHGHPVGDRVLKLVAGAFGGRMRARDVVGRFGGEEFMLILPETDGAGAAAVAERLRKKVEAAALSLEGGAAPVQVTMSFGHATTGSGRFASAGELLRAADEALYAAKRGGRNRVVGHGDHAGGRAEASHVGTLAS